MIRFALALASFSALYAQDPPPSHVNARELFYTPVAAAADPSSSNASSKASAKASSTPPDAKPKPEAKNAAPKRPAPAASAAAPLGLRYSVLKRDGTGKFQEVSPDATFRSGDRIRVQVESNSRGYLYVVSQGSSGAWKLLFPSPEVAGGSNLIQKGDARVLPSAGDTGWWLFTAQAGVEKLFVVLTRQPEPDLDQLIYSVAPKTNPAESHVLVTQASVSDEVIARLRQVSSRDLVFEKVDSDTADGKAENAAYVVNPSAAPDSRLVVDVSLRHN